MNSDYIKEVQNIIDDYIESKGGYVPEIYLAWVKSHAETALVKNNDEALREFREFVKYQEVPSDEEILKEKGISVKIINNSLKITKN